MNLLYPSGIDENETSFRKDSLALETIRALNLPKLLWMKDLDILRCLTADCRVITYRQQTFADIERAPELYDILKTLKNYVRDLRDMAQKRSSLSRSTEDVLYSFGEIQIFIEMIREITSKMEKIVPMLQSPAMLELFDTLKTIMDDENFAKIFGYVEEIGQKMRYAKSITLGLNLNAKFEVYEAGVVSINTEPYILNDWFGTLFGKSKSNDHADALKCFTPLVSTEHSNHMDQVIYRILNTDISRAVLKARSTLLAYIQSTVSALYTIYEDLDFVISGADFYRSMKEQRVKLCLPAYHPADTDDSRLSMNRLINPLLLGKMPYGKITANDISFSKGEADTPPSIFILTGPNSGGKSVYLKSIGICCLLGQLGFHVPAIEATLAPFDGIYCHFPTEDPLEESRLVSECRRMREILDEMTADSLLLMDESFSGTSASEGAVIALEVLKTIQVRRMYCFFATHLHEVAENISYLNKKRPCVKNLSAEYRNGERTYRIIEASPGGKSYGYEIAQKYGLAFNEEEE